MTMRTIVIINHSGAIKKMQGLSVNLKNEKWEAEKIYIPAHYMPSTGFGDIRLIIYDGQIVDCKITTSIKIANKSDIKKT